MDKDSAQEKLVKVVLVQEYEDSDEVDVESPWALDLGNHHYQLKNFPFFFYGLSFNDIFEAKPLHNDDPRPYFIKVIEKSGHCTVRIFLKNSIKQSAEAAQVFTQLQSLHCGYEGNGCSSFVVNIQPHCDFKMVINFIKNNAQIEVWEMADPVEGGED